MNKQLILVHGRSQQGKPPEDLKDAWVAAWEEGLKKQDLVIPITDADIKFPYYGDTLMDLVDGDDTPAPVTLHGNGEQLDPYGVFLSDVLREVQEHAAISDANVHNMREQVSGEPRVTEHGVANWPWVHAMLKAIDQYIPGASGTVIATVTRDTYLYLTNIGIRDAIEEGVLQAFSNTTPAVVVGHSLGSVVTYNLLRREGVSAKWNVPLFVTLGSPLGIQKMRQLMFPLSHPQCVSHWFNAMDPVDVVSLYPLDRKRFAIDPAIENKTDVHNDTANYHGITGYLKDPTVARKIYDALVGASAAQPMPKATTTST